MKSDEIIDKMRNKLQESDPSNRSVTNVFQFHFTDSDGNLIKSMVFDFKELNIYEGTCTDADAEITVSDENFYLVGSKETTFDDLLANNNVKIDGDAEAFNKLKEKFRLNAKKE
ncbi:uncharacterized protein LOC101900543 isoform X1 [Musca domestica]|uniref:Uncharacterized protein LOC101900543 isoform X1 n=1 Tax=Musca domestica TaxID=7370 RepID=A0A9J7I1B2_MUSDO|nr:uncharacterized protein LOC101900543 isoform X1 [Musca domestica]